MPHDQGAAGCAYGVVDECDRGCKPKEACPLGWVVYRSWAGGGHHHREANETL